MDESAPADALSHALGVARRIALGEWRKARWSPLAEGAALETRGLPGPVADTLEIGRLLGHHEAVPRIAPARAILDAVRIGLEKGLADGLAFEARVFGRAVASDEGHAGIDRFLARQSWPLPLRGEGGVL